MNRLPALALTLLLLFPGMAQGQGESNLGEIVFLSYLHSFPDKVKAVGWAKDDWTIEMGDETFYWAEGRLLPENLRTRWKAYRPHSFTVYPQEVPDPASYTPEQIADLRRMGGLEAQDGEDHHRSFQGILYGGTTRREIENALERIMFLDRRITVHSLIVEPLKRVEKAILALDDPAVKEFLDGIQSIGGYNWRTIRGAQRMSYHSWGLAVDILKETSTSKAIYWRWERARNEDWALVPPGNRWTPPEGVIRAFENEGFIWGGKWTLYDTMHFEFRPELHEINRILASREGRLLHSSAREDFHHILPLY